MPRMAIDRKLSWVHGALSRKNPVWDTEEAAKVAPVRTVDKSDHEYKLFAQQALAALEYKPCKRRRRTRK